MSWQSTPSGEQWIERDDEMPRITIPENPAIGARFMRHEMVGWDVCDWRMSGCKRCDGKGYVVAVCRCCNGTGNGSLEPYPIASVLTEADARLLVFGAELLAAAERGADAIEDMVRWGADSLTPEEAAVAVRDNAVLAALRNAIAKARTK